MLGRFWRCWSRRCGNAGRRAKLRCGPTAAFVVGRCCVGASERESTTSSDWPRTSACMRSRAKWQKRAERKYQRSGEKVRLFTQFKYKAQSWDRKRRVIAKAE